MSDPFVVLERASARRPPLVLSAITASWGPGVHALVGAREDGGSLVLALVSGAVQPRAGRVRVLGGAPTDDAVRPRIARVPLAPALPDAMTVEETLALAASVRGEAPGDARERLAALGVEALAGRRCSSLSRAEARAVALAEAVTSARVQVLLVEEPLVAMDPRAAGRVGELLRARARQGCAALSCTASARDAAEVADDFVRLRKGAVAGEAASVLELATRGAGGACLHVLAREPAGARALVAALARAPEVAAVEARDASVRARGPDAVALARAAADAAIEAGVEVIEVRPEAAT